MKKEIIKCERCREILRPKRTKWLELSLTDGNYYVELPQEHKSQGSFSFGATCAMATLFFMPQKKEKRKEVKL